MNFTLLSRKTLSDTPSASGIEVIGDSIYVIGDDSPWLFKLNKKFEVEEKIQIADVSIAVKGKIPKPLKPDIEAMAAFENDLLLFGSGSKSPQRDVLIRVNTSSKNISQYSLVKFYDALCTAAGFTRADLNLEAAVIIEKHLFLLNRGKNRIFKLNVMDFLTHAEGKTESPSTEIFKIVLASLNGIEAGFSGAAASPDGKQIVFTASVENTPNWIDDGEILGSFVGVFSIDDLKQTFSARCVEITDAQKNIIKIKAEAIAIQSVIAPGKMKILLATDNDVSGSEILEGELEW